MLLIYPGHLK